MVEGLTRRDFLRVTGITVLATLGVAGLETLISQKGEVDAADYIKVPEKKVFTFELDENSAPIECEVEVHPEGFYEGLKYIAEREDPEEGSLELNFFLKRNPLYINFAEEIREGRLGTVESVYRPSFWMGGPQLIFSYEFMRQYYICDARERMIDSLNIDGLKIYHELFHTWQEIRNPRACMYQSIIYSVWVSIPEEMLSQIPASTVRYLEKEAMKYEDEARRESFEILCEPTMRSRYLSGHLGKFFTFSPVTT